MSRLHKADFVLDRWERGETATEIAHAEHLTVAQVEAIIESEETERVEDDDEGGDL
jgi:hypothetical protein